MHPVNQTKQHFLDSLIEMQQRESDQIMRYVIISLFLLGIAFSVTYNTWILSVPLGGLCLVAYLIAQFVDSSSSGSRWVASAVIPIFSAQFVYQLHGALDPHVFFFIGSTVLIIYQDWRYFIVSATVFFLHLAIFSILQSTEPIPDYLINAKNITLSNTFPHFLGAIVHSVLCIWWAKMLGQRSIKTGNQIGQMEHYVTEITRQKELIERANVALDAQLEERHLKMRELNEQLRAKDYEIDHVKKTFKDTLEKLETNNRQLNEDLINIKNVFDPIKSKADYLNAVFNGGGMLMIVTDLEGKITEVNSYAGKSLGYSSSELIGQQPEVFTSSEQIAQKALQLSESLGRSISPTSEVFVANLIQLQVDSDEQDWMFKKKDGTTFPVKLVMTTVRNETNELIGYVGIAKDMSSLAEKDQALKIAFEELKAREVEIQQNLDELAAINEELSRTNHAVREREQLLNTVINNLPVAVFCKDPNKDFRITLANEMAGQLFGIGPDSIGKKYADIYSLDKANNLHYEDMQIVSEKNIIHLDSIEVELSNGEKKYLSSKKIPILSPTGQVELILEVAQDLTEIKNAQKLFETVAESSPIPFVITSLESGNILFVNQPLSDIFGYKKEEVLNKPSPNFYFKPEVRTHVLELVAKQGYVNNFECQFVKKDGTVFWTLLSLRVATVFDQKCLIGGVIDIDQQKRAQDIIRAGQNRLIETLEMAELGTWELDLRSMKINFDKRHSGWLIGKNIPVEANISLPFNDFVQQFINKNDTEVINNLIETLVRGDHLSSNRFEYQLTDRTGQNHHLSAVVRGVQDQLSKTIRILATVQDITERKKQDSILKVAQAKVNDALRIASLAVWELNLTDLSITLDALHAQWIGKSTDENGTITLNLLEFAGAYVHPEDIPKIQSEVEFALAQTDDVPLRTFDYRLLNSELGTRTMLVAGSIITNGGKATQVLGTTQDITEQRNQEARIRMAQAKANQAMNQASLGVWEVDFVTFELTIDALFCSWIGVEPDENGTYKMPLSEYAEKYLYADEVHIIQEEVEYAMTFTQNGPMREFDYRLKSPDGGYRIVLITGEIITREGKPDKVFGTAQDITERRALENKISENQRQFEAMARNVPGIIYQLIIHPDDSRQYTYISPAAKSLLAIEPEELLKDARILDARVHQDEKLPDYNFTKPLAIQKIPIKFETRVIMDDGTYRWGEINGLPEMLDDGNIIINGVILDITDRKNTELEKQERQIRIDKQDEALSVLGRSEIIAGGDIRLAYQQICETVTISMELALLEIWFFNDDCSMATVEFAFDSRTLSFDQGEIIRQIDYPKHFEALKSDNIINVHYANYDPRTSELREQIWLPKGINSLLIVPIRRKGQQIGFAMFLHSGIAKKFTPDEEAFATSISELITLALEAKDRQDALNALKISNATFKSLQTAVPGVVFQFKLENGVPSFPFISEKAQDIFALTSDEIINDYNALISKIHEEDIDSFFEAQEVSFRNMSLLDWEGRGIKTENEIIWFQILASGEWIHENLYIGNGLILDITDRKHIEIEKERTQERIIIQDAAVKELAQSEFISDGTIDQHYEMITQAVASILDVSACFLMFADKDFQTLTLTDLYENQEMSFNHPNMVVTESQNPNFFNLILKERSIVLNDVTDNDDLYQEGRFYFDDRHIKSFLSASIIRNGRISGIIGVEQHHTKRNWQFDEVSFLQGIAEIISISLESKARIDALHELQKKEAELLALNDQLTGLVDARTQALNELQTAQQQLVQSEKMASLGQLVAGVAHEINTPISAVKASTRNLFRTLPVVLTEVPQLLRSLSNEEADLFIELVQQSASQNTDLTTQEERQYRMQVKNILDEYDIDNSFELAKELVEVRIVDNLEQFVSLFNHSQSADIIDKVYKLGQFKKNMENIDLAAEKTARVARALKNYSRVQSSETFTEVFIHESIETILTIYSNQLKYGISVEKHFEPLMKPVPVFPDEIGQVWTNIINNAIQALKGKGKIIIDVHSEGDLAIVKITDNGPGIPQDIINRIFEPFFTTKPQGEGTGLGLDICRKIVEKHRGTIAVDSEPGRTSFIISLPMKQEQDQTELELEKGSEN